MVCINGLRQMVLSMDPETTWDTTTQGSAMNDNTDRRLVGRYVEHEVEARTSWSKFAGTSGVSRATLYRVKAGDPKVETSTLRKVERGLGLPFDTLDHVGAHRFDELEAVGMAPSVIAWLRREATTAPDIIEHITRKTSPAAQDRIRQMRAEVTERPNEDRPNGQ